MIMMILGAISLLAGFVVMIMGKLLLGIGLFFLGLIFIFFQNSKMFRGAGYRGEGSFWGSIGGWGRQQSEAVKGPVESQGYEDRPSNIWDQVEGK